jgi:multiple sugar transport system permease protein
LTTATSASAERAGRPKRRVRTGPDGAGTAWFLLTPYLLFLLVFGVGPVVGAAWFSLGGGSKHLGTGAYSRVFGSTYLLPAVKDVAEFLLLFLPALLAFTTVVALVAHSRADRVAKAARFAYYLPGVVVGAPLVLLWLFMLDPSLSPFRPILSAFGMETTGQVLASNHLPFIFAIMSLFTAAGGWVIVLHGALQAIDADVEEAAALDGCNAWQLALYIKVPVIRRYLAFIGVISFAGATQLVAEPNIIGQAIPGTVSTTWSLNQLGYYYAFVIDNFSDASVVALLLLAVGVLAAIVLVYGVRGYSIDGRTTR